MSGSERVDSPASPTATAPRRPTPRDGSASVAGRPDREQPGPHSARSNPQTYGTIVVVGGGCYGSFYVQQLARARDAGALTWTQVVVVDRDASCPIACAARAGSLRTPDVRIVTADWTMFFREYLAAACADPIGTRHDAIVPSPLMPHLMYEWVRSRAVDRWPDRAIGTRSIETIPGMPWQRAGSGDTHYVSFAEWVCPVNCIEPAVCPKTRGPRWWTMPTAVQAYVEAGRADGRPLVDPVIFHCTHRAYGVGMFDTATAVHADSVVAEAGKGGPAEVLVGTVSHCHGALSVLTIGERQEHDGGSND